MNGSRLALVIVEGHSPHHAQTIEKQKGRIEKRSLWMVSAAKAGSYLAEELGWHGITHVGWIHHAGRRPTDATREEEETTFLASLPPRQTQPKQVLPCSAVIGTSKTVSSEYEM